MRSVSASFGRRRPEQDDVERLASPAVEGGAELVEVNQIDQPGARLVEQIPREEGAARVALDQQRPNRSRISHT